MADGRLARGLPSRVEQARRRAVFALKPWAPAPALVPRSGVLSGAERGQRGHGLSRTGIAPVTGWITHAPLPRNLMHQLQIGRPQATARLRRRLAPQRPHCEGSARNPVPAGHALTEQLNNAIDHSDGSAVTVSIRRTPLQLQLLVSDHGRGVFGRIAQRSQITEPRLAMFELSKARERARAAQRARPALHLAAGRCLRHPCQRCGLPMPRPGPARLAPWPTGSAPRPNRSRTREVPAGTASEHLRPAVGTVWLPRRPHADVQATWQTLSMLVPPG